MATNKLFVGGLAWASDEDSLRQAFEQFGSVRETKVITDRETGRSKGFGFVTFDNEEDAQEALRQLDGSSLDGRNIRVNEANERPSRGGGYRRDDRDGDGGRGGQGMPRRQGNR